jgi:hypothetical protein
LLRVIAPELCNVRTVTLIKELFPMQHDFSNPELWGFGVSTLVLLAGLAYGGIRAGWLSPCEKARTDAATIEMQRREEFRD